MVLSFGWEWMTETLLWRPFSRVFSQAIEAAFQGHQPSLDLHIDFSRPAPSHSITFQPLSPCQKNRSSGRSRPVRRNVDPESGTVDWQCWEDESQQWHSYGLPINFQIESAWEQCNRTSSAYFHASAPAGVSICINHQRYTLEFEADAVQENLFSNSSHRVRRRLISPGSGASTVAAAAGPGFSPNAPPASDSPHLGAGPDPSISAGTVSLSYDPIDLQPHVESSEDNDCPICMMNLREKDAVRLAKCRHVFCKVCITRWFETRPTCPMCSMAYGIRTGVQPNGTRSVRIIPVARLGFGSGLEGFPDVDINQIHGSPYSL